MELSNLYHESHTLCIVPPSFSMSYIWNARKIRNVDFNQDWRSRSYVVASHVASRIRKRWAFHEDNLLHNNNLIHSLTVHTQKATKLKHAIEDFLGAFIQDSNMQVQQKKNKIFRIIRMYWFCTCNCTNILKVSYPRKSGMMVFFVRIKRLHMLYRLLRNRFYCYFVYGTCTQEESTSSAFMITLD